jgi:hypothetical protein
MEHQIELFESQQIISPMTKDEATEWENKVGSAANQLRVVLFEGYERKAWEALGYSSWSEQLRTLAGRFGFGENYAWKQLKAAETESILYPGTVDNLGQIPERHLRPLSRLDTPEQKREAWQIANDTAPDGKVTAAHVQSIVDGYSPGPSRYNPTLDPARPKILYTPNGLDACQTPAYAVEPLLPYLSKNWTVWEPAAGEGSIVEALLGSGLKSVVSTDLIRGENFFELEPDNWDCIVTNPPFSIQAKWLLRCYELGKPFALLLKVDILGNKGNQELFDKYGTEVIFVRPRINFKMPYKGYDGGGAWFSTAWFTWGLSIGQQMTFVKINSEEEDDGTE